MRKLLVPLAAFLLAPLCGCGPAGRDPGAGRRGTPVVPDAGSADQPPPPENAKVYAHSDEELYSVHPDTLAVTRIGAFGWPSGRGGERMTDIALDRNGKMVGISFGAIYSVDPMTARCTHLSDFAGSELNGLSYIADDQLDPGEPNEILVAAGLDGVVYRIDPNNGRQTRIGSYGGGWASSGDIVSVEGATYATVSRGSGADVLAKVNPKQGTVTPIGSTGFSKLWGLGYWKQRVFGFTSDYQFVLIDTKTGAGTLVQDGSVSWWGAGVTTAADTTPIQ